MNIVNDFVEPFVQRAISQSTSKKLDNGSFTDALSEVTSDRTVLRDQLVNTLLAGRDTTAATLSWLFYELAYHPEVYSTLRQEVLDILGTDGNPTYENLKSMKYLGYCLNEGTTP